MIARIGSSVMLAIAVAVLIDVSALSTAGKDKDALDEIRVLRPLFKPIKWIRVQPEDGPDAVKVLDMSLTLPAGARALAVMEEQLRKANADAILELKGPDGATYETTVRYVKTFRSSLGFYAADTRDEYWEIVRAEARKYQSTASSLVMFEGLEKDVAGLEDLPADRVQQLAATMHVRKMLMGFDQNIILQSGRCTYVVVNVRADERHSSASGHLFDGGGAYRGELTIIAPSRMIDDGESKVIQKIISGIRFDEK